MSIEDYIKLIENRPETQVIADYGQPAHGPLSSLDLCKLLRFAATKGFIQFAEILLNQIEDFQLQEYFELESPTPIQLALHNKHFSWAARFIQNPVFLRFEEQCPTYKSSLVEAACDQEAFPTLKYMLTLGTLNQRVADVACKVLGSYDNSNYSWIDNLLAIDEFKAVANEKPYLYRLETAIANGNVSRVNDLLQNAVVSKNISESTESIALCSAISNGHEETVSLIFEKTTVPQTILDKALRVAAVYGRLSILRNLMNDAEVRKYIENNKPLCIELVREAARNGRLEIIDLLFQRTKIFTASGKALLDFAVQNLKPELAYEVAKLIADLNPQIVRNPQLQALLQDSIAIRRDIKQIVRRFNILPNEILDNICSFLYVNVQRFRLDPDYARATYINKAFNSDKQNQLLWVYNFTKEEEKPPTTKLLVKSKLNNA